MTRDRALAQVDSITRNRIDMHGLDDAAAAALRAAAADVRGLIVQLFDEHEYELQARDDA